MIASQSTKRSRARKGRKRSPAVDFYEHLTPKVEERFWSRVRRGRAKGACWLHVGGARGATYGRLWFGGCSVLAHRVGYALARGRFDPSLSVLHTCGEGRCVRPDHLYLARPDGTPVKAGAAPSVSEQRAQWIRHLADYGVERKVIAERYGLSRSTVDRILRKRGARA